MVISIISSPYSASSRFQMDIADEKKEFNSQCGLCSNTTFTTPEQFAKYVVTFSRLFTNFPSEKHEYKCISSCSSHLRSAHCSREGGSFVCLYGENQVCSSLPVEGISDIDYEQHIYNHHVFIFNNHQHHKRKSSSMSSIYSLNMISEKWDVYSASQNLAAVLNNPNKMKQVSKVLP